MKTYRKIISIVLTLALVMSLCIVQSPTKTQAGVKIIVGKKLDMDIGSHETILVKGKAKAKSSSKKVAKVSKVKKSGKKTKITVKGLKVGKATIKVKSGRSSKKVKVVVRPKKVKGLKVAVNNNIAKLTWSKAKGATGYYVYRSQNSKSGFKKIAKVSKTSFTNSGLALGSFYYYKVKAVGKKKITSDEYSKAVYAKTWKLVWKDEFAGNKLDTSKWNNDGATGDSGFGNHELQDYQIDYHEVKNGSLIIKPTIYWNRTKNRLDSYFDEEGTEHFRAYSTKLWTKGHHTFKYGKFEFRAKMPKGKGTWAAGWMLGTGAGGSWPMCGEIDVFETTSQAAKTLIPQSLHMKKYNGMPTSSGNKHYDTTVSTSTTAFHTYAVEWYTDKIKFTIDGKQTGVFDPADFTLSKKPTEDMTIWPYKYPFYLILNCAIGGTLGGEVGPQYWAKKIGTDGDCDIYQDYLYFDYVRVYQ